MHIQTSIKIKIFGLVQDLFLMSIQHSWPCRQQRCSFIWSSRCFTAPGHGWSCGFMLLRRASSLASIHPTLLIHRQQQVNLKERREKWGAPSLCLCWYTLFNVNFPEVCLQQFLEAVPVLFKLPQAPEGCANPTVLHLLHRWTCDDLKVFSTVFLLKQGVKSLKYLLDVILQKKKEGKKKSHPITECWRKIKPHFHLASVPLLSCFHVNHWILSLPHSASPGTLMNSTQEAQIFLY